MEKYEQLYKDAFEKSKEFYTICKKCGANSTVEFLEDAFPDLKKTEDEKIRKAILSGLKYLETELGWDTVGDVDILDAYAWLEKQGKKEEPQVYETEDGDIITYSETDENNIVEPKFKVGDKV